MADKETASVDRTHSLASRVWEAMNKDGHLAAFVRQGADEAATALKAFPDSIQVEEVGTIFSPTQGEIAADRNQRLPTPSEIAKSKTPYTPDHSNGNDQDHGHSMGRE